MSTEKEQNGYETVLEGVLEGSECDSISFLRSLQLSNLSSATEYKLNVFIRLYNTTLPVHSSTQFKTGSVQNQVEEEKSNTLIIIVTIIAFVALSAAIIVTVVTCRRCRKEKYQQILYVIQPCFHGTKEFANLLRSCKMSYNNVMQDLLS